LNYLKTIPDLWDYALLAFGIQVIDKDLTK
jgi:hypothetical protein